MNPRKPSGKTILLARFRAYQGRQLWPLVQGRLSKRQSLALTQWARDRRNAGGTSALRANDRLWHRFSRRIEAILGIPRQTNRLGGVRDQQGSRSTPLP